MQLSRERNLYKVQAINISQPYSVINLLPRTDICYDDVTLCHHLKKQKPTDLEMQLEQFNLVCLAVFNNSFFFFFTINYSRI